MTATGRYNRYCRACGRLLLDRTFLSMLCRSTLQPRQVLSARTGWWYRQGVHSSRGQYRSGEQLQQHGLAVPTFDRIDRITNLCDRIAFDVCFEAPAEGDVRIFPRNDHDEEIVVRYRVRDGVIQVAPWPFTVDSHAGYLVGYQLNGYPTVPEPVMLAYQLARTARI